MVVVGITLVLAYLFLVDKMEVVTTTFKWGRGLASAAFGLFLYFRQPMPPSSALRHFQKLADSL